MYIEAQTVNFKQALLGAAIGFIIGQCLPNLFRLGYFRWKYRELAGQYDLRPERKSATGGTVTLTARWGGKFDVMAIHPNHEENWEGHIQFGVPDANHGTGTYKHRDQLAGLGNFNLEYLEGEGLIYVLGSSRTYPGKSFTAIWEPRPKRGN